MAEQSALTVQGNVDGGVAYIWQNKVSMLHVRDCSQLANTKKETY